PVFLVPVICPTLQCSCLAREDTRAVFRMNTIEPPIQVGLVFGIGESQHLLMGTSPSSALLGKGPIPDYVAGGASGQTVALLARAKRLFSQYLFVNVFKAAIPSDDLPTSTLARLCPCAEPPVGSVNELHTITHISARTVLRRNRRCPQPSDGR